MTFVAKANGYWSKAGLNVDIAKGTGSVGAAQAIGNGQFQFRSVRPGDYRILAIPENDRVRLQTPATLERAMANAQKITLAPGVSQTVTVRLAEVGR